MINPVKYVRETVAELKLVSWPTRETTTRLTIIVIVISALVGAYIGLLDYLLTNILKFIIK